MQYVFDKWQDMLHTHDLRPYLNALPEGSLERESLLQLEADLLDLFDAEALNAGKQLISDSYFQEYALDLAHAFGAFSFQSEVSWPLSHIDWDAAAKELQQDYAAVYFDGVLFWVEND